jgi:Zn-dependent protease with chaperone function
MFNNVIYFLIVLLVFEISYPENGNDGSLISDLAMMFSCWAILALYCRTGFNRLLRLSKTGQDDRLVAGYHTLILRLSILAILLFAMDVYVFHLKYWLQFIPLANKFSLLQGIPAILIFVAYLSTIWYFAYPVYVPAFHTRLSRRSFIVSNVKLNVPVLFPWMILTFIYDLIAFYHWSGPGGILDSPEGQLIFFAVFLFILFIFMPAFIQFWWECRPFEPSERVDQLKSFLNEMHFRYTSLLRWSIFEGRMMTAAIMGIIPQLRYILITDSLMEILSVEELKAILAHEAGHAKYRHMIFYFIFMIGYIFLSFGLFDVFASLLASFPYFIKSVGEGGTSALNTFYMVLSVPIFLSMFIYFRFILGFFMRNFERQADLYSAVVMGSPYPTINSLEKIALFSGKIRNLPSWHHFSIRERVECLLETIEKPDLIRRHNRFIALSFAIYLICTAGIGYVLNSSALRQNLFNKAGETLQEQVLQDPDNISLLRSLAMFYQDEGKSREAINTYERILKLNSLEQVALNNLAWLLVTASEKELRDPPRAVTLAQKAVELERSPMFLDTLAEAYWTNGSTDKAVDTIKQAILLEKTDDAYYRKQLDKFMTSPGRNGR